MYDGKEIKWSLWSRGAGIKKEIPDGIICHIKGGYALELYLENGCVVKLSFYLEPPGILKDAKLDLGSLSIAVNFPPT